MTKPLPQIVVIVRPCLLAALILLGSSAIAEPIPAYRHGAQALAASPDFNSIPVNGEDRPPAPPMADAMRGSKSAQKAPQTETFTELEPLLSDSTRDSQVPEAQPIPEPPSFWLVGFMLLLIGAYAGHKSRKTRYAAGSTNVAS